MKLYNIKDIYSELNVFRETLFLCNNNEEMKKIIEALVQKYGYRFKYSYYKLDRYDYILTLNRVKHITLLSISDPSLNMEHPNAVQSKNIIKTSIY